MHPTNNRIADIVPEVKEWRQWLHRNPELLFDLPKDVRLYRRPAEARSVLTSFTRTLPKQASSP